MKPLLSKLEDQDSLQTLGRASVQIVHDIKNQLNGLKLYATFLRKRMEKAERPQDEQETVGKLLAGLERAASDLSTLVQFGRPLELKRQPGVDLQKILRSVLAGLVSPTGVTGPLNAQFAVNSADTSIIGEFDPAMMGEALKAVTVGAIKRRQSKDVESPLTISITQEQPAAEAVIEWSGLLLDHDPFASFAGSDEIRMSLAAKIINAHGGTAKQEDDRLVVTVPTSAQAVETSA
jgi:light-regulated signal transduction histidine kinase (bacteriophytochrome)